MAAAVKRGNPHPVQSLAFRASRRHTQFGNDNSPVPQCQAIARSTGVRCRRVALRGSKRCKAHGGLLKAAAAEEERFGKPVLILRTPRKKSLAEFGANEPWPAGLPKRADLLALGPWARGRLFEAWSNRLTSPDVLAA